MDMTEINRLQEQFERNINGYKKTIEGLKTDNASLIAAFHRKAEELLRCQKSFEEEIEKLKSKAHKWLPEYLQAKAEIEYQEGLVEQMTVINKQVNADAKALKKKLDECVELMSMRYENLNRDGKTILDFQAVWIRQERDINSKLQEEVTALKEANLELAKKYGEVQAVLFDRDQDPNENSKLREEVAEMKAEISRLKDDPDGYDQLYKNNLKLRAELEQCNKFKQGYYDEAAIGWEKFRAAERDLDTERMRLVACGVVALANTPASAKDVRILKDHRYWSVSLEDVERAVDREMALRERNRILEEHLKIIARNIKAGAVTLYWVRDYIKEILTKKEGE